MVRLLTVPITTVTGGAGVGKSVPVNGKLCSLSLVRDGSTPYASTVDITITTELSGQTILSLTDVSADFAKAPRQPTHDAAGVASLYAGSGEPVEDKFALAGDENGKGESIIVTLAQGGDGKSGTFYFLVDS